MQTERRKYPRIKPDSTLRVVCYSAEFAENPLHRTNFAVRCLDLSPKGACVVTTGRLRVGASLVLVVDVPDTATRFRGKTVVRWSQSIEKGGREAHVAGMEILDVLELQGEKLQFFATAFPRARTEDSRRKHKRVAFETAEVQCSVSGLLGSLGLGSNPVLSLVDLSEGGCQIILEKKVDPGKRVKLHMSFKKPDFKIDAEGEVRWCNRDTLSLAPKWPTGIEFKNLSHDDSAQLRLLLKNFQDSKE